VKSSQQILGLPVLSIEEGKQIGEVKHLVLNPERGRLDFLLVEDGAWYLGLKAMTFEAAQGIGEFAVTVASRSSLAAVAECAGALDLLEKDIRLSGIKVLTEKGHLVGSVSEYFTSENTGEILGCQLIPANGEKPAGIIPEKLILTYGREFLVVEEGVEDKLVAELTETDINRLEVRESTATAAPASGAATNLPAAETQPGGDSLQHFERQQRQYLLGKTVTMQIIADNGEVIAEEGETITDETIARASAADRYIQLTLNIRD